MILPYDAHDHPAKPAAKPTLEDYANPATFPAELKLSLAEAKHRTLTPVPTMCTTPPRLATLRQRRETAQYLSAYGVYVDNVAVQLARSLMKVLVRSYEHFSGQHVGPFPDDAVTAHFDPAELAMFVTIDDVKVASISEAVLVAARDVFEEAKHESCDRLRATLKANRLGVCEEHLAGLLRSLDELTEHVNRISVHVLFGARACTAAWKETYRSVSGEPTLDPRAFAKRRRTILTRRGGQAPVGIHVVGEGDEEATVATVWCIPTTDTRTPGVTRLGVALGLSPSGDLNPDFTAKDRPYGPPLDDVLCGPDLELDEAVMGAELLQVSHMLRCDLNEVSR